MAPRILPRVLPFAALAARIEPRADSPGALNRYPEITTEDVAQMLGISLRTAFRLKRDGLTLYQADALAVALGLHPLDVWSRDEWAAAVARTAAAEEPAAS